MKRSDLKVGETYLVNAYNNWFEYMNGRKATVVSLAHLTVMRPALARGLTSVTLTLEDGSTVTLPSHYRLVNKGGTHVAVRYEDGEYGVERPRSIRGPWEESRARQENFRDAQARRDRAERAERDALDVRWVGLRERLERVGIAAVPRTPGQSFGVRFTLDQIERLLELAEAGEGEQS